MTEWSEEKTHTAHLKNLEQKCSYLGIEIRCPSGVGSQKASIYDTR